MFKTHDQLLEEHNFDRLKEPNKPISVAGPFGLVAPEPAHGIRKDGPAVFERVAAVAKDELVIILPVCKRSGHILVRDGPVTENDVEVF